VTRPAGASFIDDVANGKHLDELLALAAAGRELSLGELERIACGSASPTDREAHGEYWTLTLADFCERAGLGRLERRPTGQVTLVFTTPIPSREEAWRRILDSDEAGRRDLGSG
jgi:hypothetical protein